MIPIPTSIFNKFERFDMDIYSSSTINSTVHLTILIPLMAWKVDMSRVHLCLEPDRSHLDYHTILHSHHLAKSYH